MDWVVFGISAVAAVAFIAWGVLGSESLQSFASTALEVLVRDGGWVFVLAGTAFVIFALWLAFSKYGRIPLGEDDEKPEFRTSSWIAMMFAAGMGIGLMFYGVSEPVTHFTSPPPGSVEAGSDAAVGTAMATSLFHWTLHPWAIYSVVGLAIAYASYRRGRKQLISSAFVPFFGKRASESAPGRVIDALAVFATVFGTAASLGIGATQIAAGLTQVGWVDSIGNMLLVGIITVLIIAFVISAVSGVSKGIQYLSNSNMVLALLLAVFLFFVGPTVFILDVIPLSVGSYLADFGAMISRTGAVGGEEMESWLSSWTIFYWAWWISWAPFVGMFIARISRGRTIRQFIGGVLLVPSVISLVWFAILGGTALSQERGGAGLTELGGAEDQLFQVFRNLPLTGVASVLAMLLIINFFVTSADSASVVLGSMSQRGSARPNKFVVVFWGLVIGGVAIVMLLTGGEDALSGLNNTTIIAASPFVVVVLAMCMALVKDLRSDPMMLRDAKGAEVLEQAVIVGTEEHDGNFQLVTTPVEPAEEPESTSTNGKSDE
ncbi:BCCT family transporter [Saccharopolyspora hordei]|uniref:Choline/carnitine/betaine transport n=1 Tax=Saccharopolyspora hordei TaxID=1838 RepID=A0A853ACY1_9PSEU|nr:BCCT family transporter [Saccharopolyspora hordei]NYI81975.1 choline/carnitine/betaine transport [Saccharopolyspora hordei]